MRHSGEPRSAPWTAWPVGARVMVRQRVDSAESDERAFRYTDVLGELVASGPWGVTVRRDPPRASHPEPWAPGTEVTIPAERIAVGKLVPPRPARRPRRAPTAEE